MQALVTIIMPVYNAGSFLLQALESIIYQTYKNLEIILVDDGSTDDCIKLLKISDPRIIFLKQENMGKAVAVNNALKISKGKYYTIQDADDLSYPDRIEVLVDFMENNCAIAAVFSGYDIIISGHRFAPIINKKTEKQCKKEIEFFQMPSHDPTGFYRRKTLENVYYNPDLKIGQGYDYILQVGESHLLFVVPNCLYSYRINNLSTTRSNSLKKIEMIKKVWYYACKRRGINFDYWLSANEDRLKAIKINKEYDIVSHCLESVISLKICGNYKESFNVAIRCFFINPKDYNFLKPLFYYFLPLKVVKAYRYLKSRRYE